MADSRPLDCPPLSLQTLYNIRDLGGHPTDDGRKRSVAASSVQMRLSASIRLTCPPCWPIRSGM